VSNKKLIYGFHAVNARLFQNPKSLLELYIATGRQETVRRFVGLGSPPVELRTSAEVIAHVRTNPGAVAYIDADEVPAGMNVLQQK